MKPAFAHCRLCLKYNAKHPECKIRLAFDANADGSATPAKAREKHVN